MLGGGGGGGGGVRAFATQLELWRKGRTWAALNISSVLWPFCGWLQIPVSSISRWVVWTSVWVAASPHPVWTVASVSGTLNSSGVGVRANTQVKSRRILYDSLLERAWSVWLWWLLISLVVCLFVSACMNLWLIEWFCVWWFVGWFRSLFVLFFLLLSLFIQTNKK